jgi:hypothetical protein
MVHELIRWFGGQLVKQVTVTCNPAAITGQPTSNAACPGERVSFGVTATGAGLTYQWRKNAANLSNGGHYSNVTTATMTVSSISSADAANYDCVVTGACSPSAISNHAILTVRVPPGITAQPTSLVKRTGASAAFSVTATGTALTYQWRRNGSDIVGATSSIYTIGSVAAGNAGNYNCVVSGTCGPAVTSATATLTVLTDDGSIAAARLLGDGAPASLGNKDLYLKWAGFGYIEEPGLFSGIRVQGPITASQGERVCLIGIMRKPAGSEPYIEVTTMTPAGSGTVRPVGATGTALRTTLVDGLFVMAWGRVKAGSLIGNSYVIVDGSDTAGVKVMTAGAPGVSEGDFITVSGAAGLDAGRVIYKK